MHFDTQSSAGLSNRYILTEIDTCWALFPQLVCSISFNFTSNEDFHVTFCES